MPNSLSNPIENDDNVNHPKHYTGHPSGIECITITEHMSFCLGNAVKYIWRADLKNDAIEDLEKAKWYISREIERRKGFAVDEVIDGPEPPKTAAPVSAYRAYLRRCPEGWFCCTPALTLSETTLAIMFTQGWLDRRVSPDAGPHYYDYCLTMEGILEQSRHDEEGQL